MSQLELLDAEFFYFLGGICLLSGLHFFCGLFGFGCLIFFFFLGIWVVKRDVSLCENVAPTNAEHFKAQDLHMSLRACLTSSVSPWYSGTWQLSLHLPRSTDLTIQGQESAPPRRTFVSRLAEGLARHHCLKIKV